MVFQLLSAVAKKLTLGAAELGSLVVVEPHVYCEVGCKEEGRRKDTRITVRLAAVRKEGRKEQGLLQPLLTPDIPIHVH